MNHTHPIKTVIDNIEDHDITWFDIRILIAEAVIKKGFKDKSVNSFAGYKEGTYSGKGWKYFSDNDISIHRYGSAQTCHEAIKIANQFGLDFLVEFSCKNDNNLYPNKNGIIEIIN